MILVTGGAGYLGAVLVPKLLDRGHEVAVLDCFLYGREPLDPLAENARLTLIEADLRDHDRVRDTLRQGDFETVIHLAAISNDPSSELDPDLTREVNLVGLEHLFKTAKASGVRRLLYASSASVYGIKEEPEVHEGLPLDPLTLYARYKAEGESILHELIDDDFCGVAVRAATVCGYSPRLRLDLTINILTEHALKRGHIRVFGGSQERPNIHIEDLTDFYAELVTAPAEKVNHQAFNVSRENSTVLGLAEMIRDEIDPGLEVRIEPTDDLRSYSLSARKAERVLGFLPRTPLVEAVRELRDAFADDRVSDSSRSIYRNVAWMKEHRDFWTFER